MGIPEQGAGRGRGSRMKRNAVRGANGTNAVPAPQPSVSHFTGTQPLHYPANWLVAAVRAAGCSSLPSSSRGALAGAAPCFLPPSQEDGGAPGPF